MVVAELATVATVEMVFQVCQALDFLGFHTGASSLFLQDIGSLHQQYVRHRG